jgi:hypothetical protein
MDRKQFSVLTASSGLDIVVHLALGDLEVDKVEELLIVEIVITVPVPSPSNRDIQNLSTTESIPTEVIETFGVVPLHGPRYEVNRVSCKVAAIHSHREATFDVASLFFDGTSTVSDSEVDVMDKGVGERPKSLVYSLEGSA